MLSVAFTAEPAWAQYGPREDLGETDAERGRAAEEAAETRATPKDTSQRTLDEKAPLPPPVAVSAPPAEAPPRAGAEDLMASPFITGSREVGPVALAPGAAVVITREEMERNGWRSVAEVLANTPGLYVTSDGSMTTVAGRGVTGGVQAGTRLLAFMINGTPVNFRPELRAFVGPEYIPFEAIERIEIMHGPFSARFGPGALIATVNVITRAIPEGSLVEVSGGAMGVNADRAGYAGSGVVAYGGEHARLLLGVTTRSIDRSRLRIERTFEAQDPSSPSYAPFFAGSSFRDYARPAGVFLQLQVPSASAGTLSFDGGLQQLDANTEFRLNSVLTHQSRESLRNVWLNLRHENRWSDLISSQIDVGYSFGKPTRDERLYRTGNPAQFFERNFGYKALRVAAAIDLAPLPWLSAELGAEANLEFHDILFYTVTFATAQGARQAGEKEDLIAQGIDRSQTISTRSAFLTVNGQPLAGTPSLRLTGNLRVDGMTYGDTELGTMFSARAYAVGEWLPWLVTKVGIGRGFHAPSAVLMYGQSGFGLTNNLIGNLAPSSGAPPLEAQRSDSVEAGVTLSLVDVLLFELTLFHQRIDRRLEFAFIGSDFVARNVGKQRLTGGEARIRTALGPVNPFASAWFVKPDEAMVAYPGFMANLGVDVALFDRPSLFFTGRGRHVGARRATRPNEILNGNRSYSLEAYQTLDLSLSVRDLALLGKGASTDFIASAQNVTDERYSEPGFGGFDVPALGRTAFLEVRQTF